MKIQRSLVKDEPGHPVAARCVIEYCHYGELAARVEAAEDALALQAQERQWQPIETALKDGSDFIVGAAAWAAVGRFRDERWWTTHPPIVGVRPHSRGERADDPTHWMPLPSLPSAAAPVKENR